MVLSGDLPTELGLLSRLILLDLSHNFIACEIPTEIFSGDAATQLECLYLEENKCSDWNGLNFLLEILACWGNFNCSIISLLGTFPSRLGCEVTGLDGSVHE
jgi:hypothetical protein